MRTIRSSKARGLGMFLLLTMMIAGCSRCSPPPEKKVEPTPAPTLAPTKETAPTVRVEPSPEPTLNVVPSPPVEAKAPPPVKAEAPEKDSKGVLCEQVVAGLRTGDTSVLKKLPKETLERLEKEEISSRPVACLAIADANVSLCEALSTPRKEECKAQLEWILGLKKLPKGNSALPALAPQFYRLCLNDFPAADCEKFREAWTTGKVGLCKGLAKDLSGLCSAALRGDAKLCSPADVDCRALIENLPKLQDRGIAALQGDPMMEAALKGRDACNVYLSALAQACER